MQQRIVYAENEFRIMRMDNLLFVDNSIAIRQIADQSCRHILFCRPPRFGKSLLLSMLRRYFDENTKSDMFTKLFSGLEISKDEHTAFAEQYARKYKVLMLRLCPDISPVDDERVIEAKFNALINGQIKMFQSNYKDLQFDIETSCCDTLQNILTAMSVDNNNRLMVLIDEFDQIPSILLRQPDSYYQNLTSKLTVVRNFFVRLKNFQNDINFGDFRSVTVGVCPLSFKALSGCNVLQDLSFSPSLANMLGFTGQQVEKLLLEVDPALNEGQTKRIMDTLRHYYNGYLFVATGTGEKRLFNPQMILHFLQRYQENLCDFQLMVRDRSFRDWSAEEVTYFVNSSDSNALPTEAVYSVLCNVPSCTTDILEKILRESDSLQDGAAEESATAEDGDSAVVVTDDGDSMDVFTDDFDTTSPSILTVDVVDIRRGEEVIKLENLQYLLWLVFHFGVLTIYGSCDKFGNSYVLRLTNKLARIDFARVLLKRSDTSRSILRSFWSTPDCDNAQKFLNWILKFDSEHWHEQSLQCAIVSSIRMLVQCDGSLADLALVVKGSYPLISGSRSGDGRNDHECDVIIYDSAKQQLIHMELKHVLAADLILPSKSGDRSMLRSFKHKTRSWSKQQILDLQIDAEKQKKYNTKNNTAKAQTPAEMLEDAHAQLRVRAGIFRKNAEWKSFKLVQFAVIEIGDILIVESTDFWIARSIV